MTLRGNIISETGLDLSDAQLVDAPSGLASMFVERLGQAFPFPEQLLTATRTVMTAYRSITTATSVAGVYTAAFAALQSAAGLFEGRLDDDISENFQHLENARRKTAETYLHSGDWSVVVPAGGVPVGTADLYDNAGGWDAWEFRAQYNPGIVWMSKRTAKSDILLPTWPTPPYTSGYGFPKPSPEPLNSPLTGFMIPLAGIPNIRPTPKGWTPGKFVSGQPTCASIPEKFEHMYFGNMPVVSQQELAELQGPVTGRLKALQRIINKMDEAFYKKPLVPPPDYFYLFSVGTYPYTSWGTGDHAGAGSYVTFNATMAAMAMAIHSLTPMHAAIDSRKVAQCYRAWLAATRLRQLPLLPKKQIDGDRIYLDADGLPYAVNPRTWLPCVTASRPGEPHDTSTPAGPDRPLALGTAWSKYQLPVEVVRAVELSFRSFFRIRRAAVYQLDLTTDNFRKAAAESPDPDLRSAAKGKPPTYKPWRAEDPLGDGWRPGLQLKAEQANVSGLGFASPPTVGGAGLGGVVAAGALSYGLYRWLSGRR